MQPIVAPVKIGASGPQVANLQDPCAYCSTVASSAASNRPTVRLPRNLTSSKRDWPTSKGAAMAAIMRTQLPLSYRDTFTWTIGIARRSQSGGVTTIGWATPFSYLQVRSLGTFLPVPFAKNTFTLHASPFTMILLVH